MHPLNVLTKSAAIIWQFFWHSMKGTSVCLLTSYNCWFNQTPILPGSLPASFEVVCWKRENSVNLGFVAFNGLCDTAVLINTKMLEQTILISGNFWIWGAKSAFLNWSLRDKNWRSTSLCVLSNFSSGWSSCCSPYLNTTLQISPQNILWSSESGKY